MARVKKYILVDLVFSTRFYVHASFLAFLIVLTCQITVFARHSLIDSLPANAALMVNLAGPLSLNQPFLELRYRPACQWQKYRLDVSLRAHSAYQMEYYNDDMEFIGESRNPYALGGTLGLNRLVNDNGWCIRLEAMYRYIHSDNRNWLRHRDYGTDRLHAYSRRVHQLGVLVGVEGMYLDSSPVQKGRVSLKLTLGVVRNFDQGAGLLPHHNYTYDSIEGRSIFFYDMGELKSKMDIVASIGFYFDLIR